MTTKAETTPLKSVSLDFGQTPYLWKLKGRSVLITRSARDIGLACATKLAEAGATVTISNVRSETEEAQNLFDMIPTEAPSIDSEPPKPGYRPMDVNLRGVYDTHYLALCYFRLPRDSSFASLAGYVGFPSSPTYSMSKFGVRGLFYGTRDRVATANPPVRVNLVAPWFIPTVMTAQDDFQASEAGAMMKAMGSAQLDDVQVVHFIADKTAHGRAAGIFPQGVQDLGDDLEGDFAGQRTQQGVLDILAAMIAATGKQCEGLMRQDSATGGESGQFMGVAR
ncbi:NAD(P)-binding protein [Macroventuria anomochaeta]|uniref:NAD(P)-binding protein n=1 Tax=Macroventuria anomochaeta TaxID=301207 RepID=A0ACB6S7U4_9PLEO|nr:NAD(P)-binding protein [Macroventuria anomochaeta]KAF2629429.1 NAD(P)-binding protein [Macroventuria anomochaeta]